MFNVVGAFAVVKLPYLSAFQKALRDIGSDVYEVEWLYYPSMFGYAINKETTIFGLQIINLWLHEESNFVHACDNNDNHYIVILGKCL